MMPRCHPSEDAECAYKAQWLPILLALHHASHSLTGPERHNRERRSKSSRPSSVAAGLLFSVARSLGLLPYPSRITCLSTRTEPRWNCEVNRDCGTEYAIPRWLQRFVRPQRHTHADHRPTPAVDTTRWFWRCRRENSPWVSSQGVFRPWRCRPGCGGYRRDAADRTWV